MKGMSGSTGSRAVLAAAICAAVILSGCLVLVRKVEVSEVRPESRVPVKTPLKAHLVDGRVAVFRDGAVFTDSLVIGDATVFDLNLAHSVAASLHLDSVAAFETFSTKIDGSRTLKMSAIATAIPIAIIGVVCATDPKGCFGSCPTVYSHGSEGPVLEAESFSNSISHLLENRDIDRLSIRPDPDGRVRLEVRNEAVETHYINHLEVLSVDHRPDEYAVPLRDGRALIASELRSPTVAIDKAGNVVTGSISAADGDSYQTDPAILAMATEKDLFDHVDLEFGPVPGDSAAIILTARNSLLNTVLFYDFMLSGQGPGALDWLGKEMESISTALSVGSLYMNRMGLRVSVWDGEKFVDVARRGNTGPIAWDEIGITVPVLSDELRVRLSFLADSWRVDRVVVAERFRHARVTVHPLVSVTVQGVEDLQSQQRLLGPDDSYLVTMPGDHFEVLFDASGAHPGDERTLFLAAQGFYTEWLRRDWIRGVRPTAFEASDRTLLNVISRWQEVKSSFEKQFVNSRIPVR